ncbi:hypothetical protein DSM104299_03188 [Baekduia alba]|nr:hypothetical protein DSM104299_03188 [Baekduia alba]
MHGGEQLALTLFAPTKLIAADGYARRVTASMLRWLGPPHALSFEQAWEHTMHDLPAPIGWRGAGARDKASPVLFLRARLKLAWEDEEAVDFGYADLASLVDHTRVARAGSSRASVVA